MERLSCHHCITVSLYLYVNLATLESGRCFLPRLVFFLNGFNTQSAFRVQKTDYLIAPGRRCVNKWWTSIIVALAKAQCHLQLILLQSICWIWQFTLVTMNQIIHKQQHQNPNDNHKSSNGNCRICKWLIWGTFRQLPLDDWESSPTSEAQFFALQEKVAAKLQSVLWKVTKSWMMTLKLCAYCIYLPQAG